VSDGRLANSSREEEYQYRLNEKIDRDRFDLPK
jgi:hypothetical protein